MCLHCLSARVVRHAYSRTYMSQHSRPKTFASTRALLVQYVWLSAKSMSLVDWIGRWVWYYKGGRRGTTKGGDWTPFTDEGNRRMNKHLDKWPCEPQFNMRHSWTNPGGKKKSTIYLMDLAKLEQYNPDSECKRPIWGLWEGFGRKFKWEEFITAKHNGAPYPPRPSRGGDTRSDALDSNPPQTSQGGTPDEREKRGRKRERSGGRDREESERVRSIRQHAKMLAAQRQLLEQAKNKNGGDGDTGMCVDDPCLHDAQKSNAYDGSYLTEESVSRSSGHVESAIGSQPRQCAEHRDTGVQPSQCAEHRDTPADAAKESGGPPKDDARLEQAKYVGTAGSWETWGFGNMLANARSTRWAHAKSTGGSGEKELVSL